MTIILMNIGEWSGMMFESFMPSDIRRHSTGLAVSKNPTVLSLAGKAALVCHFVKGSFAES